MPAHIVVVLREPMLAGKTVEALAKAGYNAIAMINSMAALEALARLIHRHSRDSLAGVV